jgi:hypothetical protein
MKVTEQNDTPTETQLSSTQPHETRLAQRTFTFIWSIIDLLVSLTNWLQSKLTIFMRFVVFFEKRIKLFCLDGTLNSI